MKLTKKKVVLAAVAICLVAILSMGTLAWFSAEDSVTNNFYIADSNDDGEADFTVDVEESNDGGATWEDEDGLTFTDILPGDTYDKWARVVNTSDSASDRYTQYIRVTITVEGTPEWKDTDNGLELKDYLGIDETDWNITSYTYDAATQTSKIVMYYNDVLAESANVDVFRTVTIPSVFVNDANSALNLNDFSINVYAEAIQAENTADNAIDAFALLG